VKRFNGMFCLCDLGPAPAPTLSRAGPPWIKPLYYVTIGGKLLFASEIKSLMQDPACPREMDSDSLAELFTFRYVPSPKTLFQRHLQINRRVTRCFARPGRVEIKAVLDLDTASPQAVARRRIDRGISSFA